MHRFCFRQEPYANLLQMATDEGRSPLSLTRAIFDFGALHVVSPVLLRFFGFRGSSSPCILTVFGSPLFPMSRKSALLSPHTLETKAKIARCSLRSPPQLQSFRMPCWRYSRFLDVRRIGLSIHESDVHPLCVCSCKIGTTAILYIFAFPQSVCDIGERRAEMIEK